MNSYKDNFKPWKRQNKTKLSLYSHGYSAGHQQRLSANSRFQVVSVEQAELIKATNTKDGQDLHKSVQCRDE